MDTSGTVPEIRKLVSHSREACKDRKSASEGSGLSSFMSKREPLIGLYKVNYGKLLLRRVLQTRK